MKLSIFSVFILKIFRSPKFKYKTFTTGFMVTWSQFLGFAVHSRTRHVHRPACRPHRGAVLFQRTGRNGFSYSLHEETKLLQDYEALPAHDSSRSSHGYAPSQPFCPTNWLCSWLGNGWSRKTFIQVENHFKLWFDCWSWKLYFLSCFLTTCFFFVLLYDYLPYTRVLFEAE